MRHKRFQTNGGENSIYNGAVMKKSQFVPFYATSQRGRLITAREREEDNATSLAEIIEKCPAELDNHQNAIHRLIERCRARTGAARAFISSIN